MKPTSMMTMTTTNMTKRMNIVELAMTASMMPTTAMNSVPKFVVRMMMMMTAV